RCLGERHGFAINRPCPHFNGSRVAVDRRCDAELGESAYAQHGEVGGIELYAAVRIEVVSQECLPRTWTERTDLASSKCRSALDGTAEARSEEMTPEEPVEDHRRHHVDDRARGEHTPVDLIE